jgi:hypothetical protein
MVVGAPVDQTSKQRPFPGKIVTPGATAVPSILIGFSNASGELRAIVPLKPFWKTMVSCTVVDAFAIASRNEPAPLSLRLVTVCVVWACSALQRQNVRTSRPVGFLMIVPSSGIMFAIPVDVS